MQKNSAWNLYAKQVVCVIYTRKKKVREIQTPKK